MPEYCRTTTSRRNFATRAFYAHCYFEEANSCSNILLTHAHKTTLLCNLTDNTTFCMNQGARHKISFNEIAGCSAHKFSIGLTFVGACCLILGLDTPVDNFFKNKQQPRVVCGLSRLKTRRSLNNETVVPSVTVTAPLCFIETVVDGTTVLLNNSTIFFGPASCIAGDM